MCLKRISSALPLMETFVRFWPLFLHYLSFVILYFAPCLQLTSVLPEYLILRNPGAPSATKDL